MKRLLLLFLLSFFGATTLFAQSEPLAERLNDRLKSDILSVSFLFQTEGFFSFEDNNFLGGRGYSLGANRIDVSGTVDNNFTYRVQMQLSGNTRLLDAQLGYRFSDSFRIVTGAFKPFLSIDLDPNPGATDFINRARHISAMMNSREVGITLLGDSGGFNYRLGMYNGNGLQLSNDNKFLYTARIGYSSEMENSTFSIGFNGAVDQSENNRVGNTVYGTNTPYRSAGDRTLYGGFIQYDSSVLFGTAEFLQTKFEPVGGGSRDETITGFFVTLGANISAKDQLLVRWDYLEFDIVNFESDQIILGWNHQATSLISFQLNILGQFDNNMDGQYGALGVFQFQI